MTYPAYSGDIIHLNVGGTKFCTSRQTLTLVPDSFFTDMLSGRISSLRDESGAIFLDRDPIVFNVILNYLRTENVDLSKIDTQILRLEAEHYRITPLIEHLLQLNNQSSETSTMKADNDICSFDFRTLPGEHSKYLTSEEKYLRKNFYLTWANSSHCESMFELFVTLLKGFFTTYQISEEKDLLQSFVERENRRQSNETSIISSPLHVEVDVRDRCLFRPVLISKKILKLRDRSFASSSMKKIGVQHISKHNMIDSESSSDDNKLDEEVKRKRRKTCQDSIFQDCDGLLIKHEDNETRLERTDTKLDILILCPSDSYDICRTLARHLGVIFIEDLLSSISRKTVSETELLIRLRKEESKEYRRLQNCIMKNLILGSNNVSLTCKTEMFQIFNANVKCIIYLKKKKILDWIPHAHMLLKIDESDVLHYISAIGYAMDECMKCTSSIEAVYSRKIVSEDDSEEDKLFKVRVPIIALIPSHIVNFFGQKKLIENIHKNSLSLIY